jgi:type III pantothenate kinase
MLLAVDIGNSSIKLGVFDRETLLSRFTIPAAALQDPVELRKLAEDMPSTIEEVIISSVVPDLNGLLSDFSQTHFGIKPIFVDHTFDFGFEIEYEPPTAAGIDRLVAASAAVRKYGKPCIVCDFGTAATIDAVNAAGQYLGGVITPGIDTLSHALFQKTSKLPEIEIQKPDSVIGRSTASAIRSGIYYGYIGLVEGLLKRMIDELGEKPVVVATGGFAEMIAAECPAIEIVDKDLLLEGLQMLHSKES